jgi:hypothetical protein
MNAWLGDTIDTVPTVAVVAVVVVVVFVGLAVAVVLFRRVGAHDVEWVFEFWEVWEPGIWAWLVWMTPVFNSFIDVVWIKQRREVWDSVT